MIKPPKTFDPGFTINEVKTWPQEKILAFYNSLTREELESLKYNWRFNARPSQLLDNGSWSVTASICGRGYGKTRQGAEWVRQRVEDEGAMYIGLVAPTAASAKKIMVEGESGILAISHPDFMPIYKPTNRELIWPNGAKAITYSAEEPEQLRGPQHDTVWFDEPAACKKVDDMVEQIEFGLRLTTDSLVNNQPKLLVTTTPKPIPIIKDWMDWGKDPDNTEYNLVTGSTFENTNLSKKFIRKMLSKKGKMARQELYGEIIMEHDDPLWTEEDIKNALLKGNEAVDNVVEFARRYMVRIAIGVDPSVSETGDLQGIVVCGEDRYGVFYVLEDASCRKSPLGWAEVVVDLAEKYDADIIVAEKNQGGNLVSSNIQSVWRNAPIELVHAKKGKLLRAEPIYNLYEQGKVKHVEGLEELEEEMTNMTQEGYQGRGSPDRLDACVYALKKLSERRRRKKMKRVNVIGY